ncbi:hypothetical protein CCR97_02260 [Rhodoplanes elegans]|uniref:Methyltransferase FkbM domain-containing protein n=1 Tax=Rhodoplanes elegans TaxID=29408 RepID=A0A327K9R5_9BRAD|nr:FkbM family methyltransferase [Rhodoplanes elegans]MBK5957041.1 hypothetical protein [Rhodoplanes elegans]RAI32018.1 hypothetical protein CH338_24880 [Rhodoplanes elegans]
MGGAARATTPDRGLVFDLGLHEGHDTRYYLDKGFRVVALEANPRFCATAQASFAGRDCVVVERALASEADREITFYVRDDSTGWSSLFQDVAERDGRPSTAVRVATTTTSALFDTYGVPYYVKCDIEGADGIFVAQLVADGRAPPFVSVEIDDLEMAEQLRAAGYDRFQIVNQAHLRLYRPPNPAREGRYVPIAFHGKMSGPFGRELPPNRWVTFDALAAQLRRYQSLPELGWLQRKLLRRWGKLTNRGWLIGQSWLDVHATTAAELARR